MNIQNVLANAHTAISGCLTQMYQASKMFDTDKKWAEAISEAEKSLEELSKAMGMEYYSVREHDAATQIAHVASIMHGYRATNGRDTRAQFYNWAVEFEGSSYDPENRLMAIKDFAEHKMSVELEAGRGQFRECTLSEWHIESIKNKPKLEFDPTMPENYLIVLQDKDKQKKYQNEISAALERHMIEVCDKLEGHGWHGVTNLMMTSDPVNLTHESNMIGAYFKPILIEETENIIGGSWQILQKKEGMWQTIESIQDGLNRSSKYIADQIMSVKNQELNKVSAQAIREECAKIQLPVEVADSDYCKTTSGKIIGKTGMHIIQNAGKHVIVYPTHSLSRIPALNEEVTIACNNGKSVVSEPKLQHGKDQSR